MGKTYTDFSQLSKGMFRKCSPVEEMKPLPKTKAVGGDDALSFFGLNAPETPTGASGGVGAGDERILALEADVRAIRAESAALEAAKAEAERKAGDLECQLAAERQMRETAEAERERLRGEVMRLRNELEDALTVPSAPSAAAAPVQEVRVDGLLKSPMTADHQGYWLVRRCPHDNRVGETGLQIRVGQQALEDRLRQCPHSDLENPVRPSRRVEHGDGHCQQMLLRRFSVPVRVALGNHFVFTTRTSSSLSIS